MIKGLVIAGNYREYRDWCMENYLNLNEYIYIQEPINLMGYHNIPINYVGQYRNNPAWKSEKMVEKLFTGVPEIDNLLKEGIPYKLFTTIYRSPKIKKPKINLLEIILTMLTVISVLGISIFGISKAISLLEELFISYMYI